MWSAAIPAFGMSFALMPLTIRWLRRLRVFDHPNSRSLHSAPTPRGAGIAVVVAALVGLVLAPFPWNGDLRLLAISLLLFTVIGLLEDLVGIPTFRRLGMQFLGAAGAVSLLVVDLDGRPVWQVAAAVFCFLWLVAYTNAFNFMDGMNGISAAQVVVATITWVVVARLESVDFLYISSLVLLAATIPFIPWNFPRAKVFLGDVGSYGLGIWLAVSAVIGVRHGIPVEAMLAPLSLYLADTGTVLIRRFRAGEPIYTPHRTHAYQRLVQRGWSHLRCTSVVAGFMIVVSLLGMISLQEQVGLRMVAVVLGIGVLAIYITLPEILDRRSPDVTK